MSHFGGKSLGHHFFLLFKRRGEIEERIQFFYCSEILLPLLVEFNDIELRGIQFLPFFTLCIINLL